MPGLDGYELARTLRTQPGLGRAKLVALTFHSDETHVRSSREAGFDFHFVKPMEPMQIKMLRRLMDTLNELVQIAGKTEEMARENLALTSETRELIKGVEADIKEVKEDVKEIKHDVEELKQEVREIKEARGDEHPGDGTFAEPGLQAEG